MEFVFSFVESDLLLICSPRLLFGYIPPPSLQQLQISLLNVAKALIYLHSKNIVHHDLRWENIGYHDNNYYVIDLDEASEIKEGIPARTGLSTMSHAPEVTKVHDWRVDIWSFGYLIFTSKLETAHTFSDLSKSCLDADPDQRWDLSTIYRWLLEL